MPTWLSCHVTGNALKFRDWLSSIAHDNRFRTYHARAVEPLTGAITLQPNVLRSKVLEKMIWYAAQLTLDDVNRAAKFNELVEEGRLEEEEGYADILNDSLLSEDDRREYLSFYTNMASQNVINLFSIDHAVIISAIHARDGIRLPPYRALWIYDQVFNKRQRIPFPSAKLQFTNDDDALDARMVMPTQRDFLTRVSSQYDLSVGLEEFEGCTWEREDSYIAVQGAGGKKYHRYKASIDITPKVREIFSRKPSKHQFSMRNSKVKKKKGLVVSAKRGRASVNWYKPKSKPDLQRDVLLEQSAWVPSHQSGSAPITSVHDDSSLDGYVVSWESGNDWLLTEQFQSCLNKHDALVQVLKEKKRSRYHFFSTEPFEHYRLNGVISFSDLARRNSESILQRTKYFLDCGLYDVPDNSKILKFGLSMPQFRSELAKKLLVVREQRNTSRSNVRKRYEAFVNDPISEELNRLAKDVDIHLSHVGNVVKRLVGTMTARLANFHGFDGVNMKGYSRVMEEYLSYVEQRYLSVDSVIKLLQPGVRKSVKGDLLLRKRVSDFVCDLCEKFKETINASMEQIKTFFMSGESLDIYNMLWLSMFFSRLTEDSANHLIAWADKFNKLSSRVEELGTEQAKFQYELKGASGKNLLKLLLIEIQEVTCAVLPWALNPLIRNSH